VSRVAYAFPLASKISVYGEGLAGYSVLTDLQRLEFMARSPMPHWRLTAGRSMANFAGLLQ